MVAVTDGWVALEAVSGQDVAGNAGHTKLVIVAENAAVGDLDLFEANSANPNESFDNSETVTAVVVGGTTAGNGDALKLSNAPGAASVTETLAGDAVVVNGAVSWDVVTGVGKSAPGSSGVEGQTVSAVVVSGATRRNSDASVDL